MKRDVKVGLFVAGVVCCVAALLLGGGVVGRPKAPPAPLSLSPRGDAHGVLPAELAESLLPPADAERLVDEIAELAVDDGAGGGDVLDVLDNVLLAHAPDDSELPLIFSDVVPGEDPDKDLREGAGNVDYAAAIAEAASLLDEELFTSGTATGVGGGGELAETDIMDITEEDLLALELAAEDAPPQPAAEAVGADFGELSRAARNAVDVAAEVPSLRIAPPARGIAVPAPAKHVYIMKRGDSFWTVSKNVYGAGKYFKNILLANPDIEPKKLRPDDKIAIPEIPGVPMRRDLLADPRELEAKRKPRMYLKRDKIHEVQPGETLQDIARTYYGYMHKWPHIVRANLDLDPRKIRPGDKIVVPALTE